MSIKVSFIIPHKGREAMLIETIESIAAQTFSKDELEVLVVSQNDSASDTLQALSSQLPLTVIFNPDGPTISHSRNLGAKHAKGHYFAFLDADVKLAPNWVFEMLKTIENQDDNVVLASAMQVNSDNAPPLEKIRTALSNAELDSFASFLPGRNLFLGRDTFYSAGQFPEHLQTCEDYYFTDKVNKLGNMFYTSASEYVHLGEDKEYVPMFKKEIWRGQSNLASLSGRTIPLREIPSFLIPFAVVGAWLFGLAICFAFPTFGLICIACGFMPVMIYTARLKLLVGKHVDWLNCIKFYLMYFPARALGTVLGIGSTVKTSSHK